MGRQARFSFALVLSIIAHAAAQKTPSEPARPSPPVVVATVDGEPIYVAEVERELTRALGRRKVEPETLPAAKALVLRRLIDRRLILAYLERTNFGASRQDVNLELERFIKRLAQKNTTLADYLKRAALDEAALRRRLAWRSGWQRCLDRYLTNKNLKKYFDLRRRDFDGTQLLVAHILLRVEPDSQRAVAATIERMGKIRHEIMSGEISFAEAAKRYSAAPTDKEKGGSLGPISRHEPMSEAFSRAAFALEKGRISEPVVTAFGVHLIQCQEIKPGDRKWQDVRDPLEKAAAAFLFRRLVQRQRAAASPKIEFTGVMPFFKPGTEQVVGGR